jgi:hypothetical protein
MKNNNETSIPLRRAELISPFGVGAISTNNEGINMMTGALDQWFKGKNVDLSDFRFNESRLENILGIKEFRLPPDYRSIFGKGNTGSLKNVDLKIPMLLFPTWFYCNRCRKMERLHLADISAKKRCKHCQDGHLVQVPFVTVCSHGHIDDFPWNEWVHKDISPTCKGTLKLVSTGGATLTSMRIECITCGGKRSLKGITSKFDNGNNSPLFSGVQEGGKYLCTGRKHWYGTNETAHEQCFEQPFVLLRNSNNVYYPDVISALYLPGEYSSELKAIIEFLKEDPIKREIQALKGIIEDNDKIATFLLNKFEVELRGANVQIIKRAFLAVEEESIIIDDEEFGNIEQTLRFQEYCSLIKPVDTKHLKVVSEFNSTSICEFNNYGISKVHRVPKLRDTRVLYGFQRLKSEQIINREAIRKGRELLFKYPNHQENNWLPGYTVYGEGIFIEFDNEALDKWENSASVKNHFNLLMSRYNKVEAAGIILGKELTPRFVMLHTLVHILISEMIFECGYSTSALRERLYISKDNDKKMNGFLIYTASGDSEGTMGGLVRLGQTDTLIQILKKSLDKSKWCSSDPVCTDIGLTSGQGIHSLNIAACHNCAYLPETSCEEFNRFLDRSLLVGVPSEKGVGFFENLINYQVSTQ